MEARNVVDVLPEKDRSLPQATLRTQQAYAALGNGNPSKEDCQIILVDLALATGYYHTTPAAMPAEQVKYAEGMRAVYGRIMRFINMPLGEVQSYQRAVLDLHQRVGDEF